MSLLYSELYQEVVGRDGNMRQAELWKTWDYCKKELLLDVQMSKVSKNNTKYHYYIKTSIPSTQNHPASLICQYLMTPPIEYCVKWVKRVKCITQLNNEQCFFMKSEHPSILFSVSLSGLQGVVLKSEHLKVIMLRLKRKLFLSFVHQALEQEIFSLFS